MRISELQQQAFQQAEDKGFHDDTPRRSDYIPGERGEKAHANAMTAYHGNKLMLIMGELSEAHDELRKGRLPDETYYPTAGSDHTTPMVPGRFKPEGVPSEIADTVIRCFDYAGIANFDLEEIIAEKLAFNATRPAMHGGKAF